MRKNNNRKDDFNMNYLEASNNKPMISIITAVFNGEKYLEQTIKSIINQTYKNF